MAKSILDENVQIKMLTFERLKQSMTKMIGATAAQNMEMRTWEDPILNSMVIEFCTDVLAQKLVDDTYKAHFSYEVPASWWQHFKQDKAPKWFTKRYPVRYDTTHQTRTVRFKRYATYPMANVAMPKDQRTIQMLGTIEVLKDVAYQE